LARRSPQRYIFLDPDGTHELGLVVIVAAKTGVRYAHQCGGHSVEVREIEGFAVPLAGAAAAQPLRTFFWKRFRGNPPAFDQSQDALLGEQWTADALEELETLIGQIAFWRTYPPEAGIEDEYAVLQLDQTRLRDLTEGWVPVRTAYGSGVLIFANSD